MSFRILTVCLLTILWSTASADDYRKKVNEGYEYYKNGEYDKAAEYYRQAGILKPDKVLPKIGKGASLYRENDFQAAGKEFAGVLDRGDDRAKADALYNIGNSHYRSEDYENAARSYIEALKIRPDDPDYKHNLEMSLIEQQQQKQNQDSDENQDKQDQQQRDGQEKGNQENERDQPQQDNQSQQDRQEQDKQDQQQQQPQPRVADDQRMTEEEAKNLLSRFEEDEKDIQRELKQVNLRGGSGRDW
jgi:tetratricopeptide (TPR) repeat protein